MFEIDCVWLQEIVWLKQWITTHVTHTWECVYINDKILEKNFTKIMECLAFQHVYGDTDWVTLTLVVHHVTVMWVGLLLRRVTRHCGCVPVPLTSLVGNLTSETMDYSLCKTKNTKPKTLDLVKNKLYTFNKYCEQCIWTESLENVYWGNCFTVNDKHFFQQ